MVNVFELISKIPQFLTTKTTELISSNGFIVTERWTSGLFVLISILLLYLGIVLVKPLLKWSLIVLSIILLIGIFVPW
jgi:hypothetical protein